MYKTLFLILIENIFNKTWLYLCFFYQAGVVKLVDTLDLGSSAERRGGSNPSARTTNDQPAAATEPEGTTLLSEPKGFGPPP